MFLKVIGFTTQVYSLKQILTEDAKVMFWGSQPQYIIVLAAKFCFWISSYDSDGGAGSHGLCP